MGNVTSSGQLSQLNIRKCVQENKTLTFQKGSKTSSQQEKPRFDLQ